MSLDTEECRPDELINEVVSEIFDDFQTAVQNAIEKHADKVPLQNWGDIFLNVNAYMLANYAHSITQMYETDLMEPIDLVTEVAKKIAIERSGSENSQVVQ